ncbi:MAG TPA: phosphonate C-P lyase system protein PhnG [Candidatus Aphodovivens excrementavium]|nr:phosphonate C-P lyase system protein PhnG [Candidatus Aphodovivens excrementavium]
MKRYERTRVLVEGNPSLASEIVRDVEAGVGGDGAPVISVLDEPREELVMVQVRETAQGSLFYLGEALMTSCRVRVGETVGLGLLLGSNRCRAYELAVIDAAFSGPGGAAFAARWDDRLAQEAARIRACEAAEQQLVQRTKVDFSTMDEPGAASGDASEEGGQR